MTLDTLRLPTTDVHPGGSAAGDRVRADAEAAEHPALFAGGAAGQEQTCPSPGRTGAGNEDTGHGEAEGEPADCPAEPAEPTEPTEPAEQSEPPAGRVARRAAARRARRMAVTETGVPISAGWARRLACDATVIPLVLGSGSEPLDVGRATRLIPPAMRRALIARDKGCAFPGCRRPPRWCDAHHIKHWADGGITALVNLVLLCGRHHDVLHHSDWTVQIQDGRPVFTPPAWLDPLRRPRGPTDPEAA